MRNRAGFERNLVRRAVNRARLAVTTTYIMRRAERARLARKTAGAWKDVPLSGAEYVERVRGSKRLAATRPRLTNYLTNT